MSVGRASLGQPQSQGQAPAETPPAKTYSQAYVDYLRAVSYATEGSVPEALRLLANSIRLQPANNPASAIAYELLFERKANTAVKLLGHTAPISRVLYSADGTKIATLSEDHTARLWNSRTGSLLTSPLLHEESVISAAFSADGSHLVTGTKEGFVTLWNTATGKTVRTPVSLNSDILCVALSPDGKFLAAGTEDGRLMMWSVLSGEPVSSFPRYHESVNDVKFNPKSTELVAATADGTADLFDIGGQRIARLKHDNIVTASMFSADGSAILTASRDGSAALWNATTGSPLGVRLKHNSAILSASFSNDGSRIVTGSADHTARIWDAKTGKSITPALQHPTFVTEVAISTDNRFVATASVDQTVRFWDATTGDTVHLPLHTHGGLAHVAFSPDSAAIVATEGSDAVIFDTPPPATAPDWLPLLAEFDAALYNKYDYRPFDRAPMRTYLHQLEATKDNDSWTRLGRWYFAPGASRTVTPQSNLALETYISDLTKRGDGPSLEYAKDLSQGHPQWLEKITPLLAKTSSTSAPQNTKKD
jgi:WD40 repeat protein